MSNKCPVCLKDFERRFDVLQHMRRTGHTIDGIKALARNSDDARMRAYHREKTKEQIPSLRYGK